MPTGTWPLGWATGDVVTASEFAKGTGAIADSTLGGSAASIDFTSLPTSYAHLLVVVYARTDTASTSDSVGVRLNGDTAANYDYQLATATAATLTANEALAQTMAAMGFAMGNTAGANLFAASHIVIPHYAGSANNKMMISTAGGKSGTASGNLFFRNAMGAWRSSAAITRITLLPTSGGNFVTGTRATVYAMGA